MSAYQWYRSEGTWVADQFGVSLDTEIAPGVTLARVAEALARPETPPGWVYEPDVQMGPASRSGRGLSAYVYRPEDTTLRLPGVVLVHGGWWVHGHPLAQVRRANLLARAGYVTCSVSYRLSGEATWPAALEDVKSAIRWFRANHAELGLDPDRIAISGASAGGHLAALSALTPGQFEGSGPAPEASSQVQAAALHYPIADVTHSSMPPEGREMLARLLGSLSPERVTEANPVTHVTSACPPILSLTGDADVVTPLAMVRSFHDRLDAAGVKNEVMVFPGGVHGFDLVEPDAWEVSHDRLVAFLNESLR